MLLMAEIIISINGLSEKKAHQHGMKLSQIHSGIILLKQSDGPVFPVYRIGANADKLYQILRYHLPISQGGNDLWVVDSRTDTASTKFITTDLDNNGNCR